ncbi:GNAT family N-acetyltransferase [Mammaliicoccus lentus]|uniref:GNAT family N-acetyltransferase n=1 Tax=Mammaliicoccus lentus TaxID=42858 RepID=UPI001B33CBE4|nr:N-acetyltransferase [Mammaliicoccus lentus]
MEIRTIQKRDYAKVSDLIINSFTNTENGYNGESELVDKIRYTEEYIPELEIVAIKDNNILGHALLSEVYLESCKEVHVGLVLAPIEVDLKYQRLGIGKRLMEEMENRAIKFDYGFISIMGWPTYYSKFGYKPASKYNIFPPFKGIPDEAFMIKPIKNKFLNDKSGAIKYSTAFE